MRPSLPTTFRPGQVAMYVLACAAFVAALFFIGKDSHWGLTLWRIAIAALLLDIVCIMLYATERARATSES